MSISRPNNSDALVPQPELWQGPMAWGGLPLRPIENYSRAFPSDAIFVRAELIFTLNEAISPGRSRQTERAIPGLIRLADGKPAEVHCSGLDGQCWTYRMERLGRKTQWRLFAGPSFPAEIQSTAAEGESNSIEQIVVQSVLPMASTSKFISFIIRDTGAAENLAAVRDPDPRD